MGSPDQHCASPPTDNPSSLHSSFKFFYCLMLKKVPLCMQSSSWLVLVDHDGCLSHIRLSRRELINSVVHWIDRCTLHLFSLLNIDSLSTLLGRTVHQLVSKNI